MNDDDKNLNNTANDPNPVQDQSEMERAKTSKDPQLSEEEVARGGAEEGSHASTAGSETTEDARGILERQDPEQPIEEDQVQTSDSSVSETQLADEDAEEEVTEEEEQEQSEEPAAVPAISDEPTPGKWYVVHTYSGHENKVATNLKQRIESEHLEDRIFEILVPTQDKIEIRSGKKETVKEKIFPGYILVKMDLDDASWLAVRTTPGVTAFVGMGNKPTPISEAEVRSIVQFMSQGAPATFKDVFLADDTVKIIDGPFSEFIGKVESVDKEKGKVRVLVSIFGRETPVELDFLQVQKL